MGLAVSANVRPDDLERMTLAELEAWSKASERLAKRRARLLYTAVAAAFHGGKALDELNKQLTRD